MGRTRPRRPEQWTTGRGALRLLLRRVDHARMRAVAVPGPTETGPGRRVQASKRPTRRGPYPLFRRSSATYARARLRPFSTSSFHSANDLPIFSKPFFTLGLSIEISNVTNACTFFLSSLGINFSPSVNRKKRTITCAAFYHRREVGVCVWFSGSERHRPGDPPCTLYSCSNPKVKLIQ